MIPGESLVIKKAIATLDTSAVEAMAWIWDFCSNERMDETDNEGKVPVEFERNGDPSEQIVCKVKEYAWPVNSRDFILRNVWCTLSGNDIGMAWDASTSSVQLDRSPATHGYHIRGSSRGYCILSPTRGSPNQCQLIWIQQVNIGGHVPVKLMNEIQLHKEISVALNIRSYFARNKEIEAR